MTFSKLRTSQNFRLSKSIGQRFNEVEKTRNGDRETLTRVVRGGLLEKEAFKKKSWEKGAPGRGHFEGIGPAVGRAGQGGHSGGREGD